MFAPLLTPIDRKVLWTVRGMLQEYREKFGEDFIFFNYADFKRQGEKCAAQVYKETLEKALRDDKPYHIVSRWVDLQDL